MCRRCSTVIVTLVLIVATATVSVAQSGRGRQLRIQGILRGEVVAPPSADIYDSGRIEPGLSAPSSVAARSSTGLIYNEAESKQKKDSGEYHMTKGDKTAGWILLGLFVLAGINLATRD